MHSLLLPARRSSQTRCLPASLLLALLALSPLTGFANGTRLPNQDADATARGNDFVSTADNPSAIYYNPAGITQLSGLQVLSESYMILSQYDYTPAGGSGSVGAKRTLAVVPQFYATYTPKNSPLSYGIGVYSPYGQSSDWPNSSGFRTIATYNAIEYITVAPTVAWKISPDFSLGAGLQINQVNADLRRGISPTGGDQFFYKGDATSIGYNLGALWKITEHHVIGLSYQSRATSHFKGDAYYSSPAFSTSSPGSLKLPFPDVITLGYSWRPTPDWNIGVSIDRTNWDLLNTPTLQTSTLGSTSIPFNWKPSYYYQLGVTRRLPDNWSVSAGYCYSTNSVPSSTFSPSVPDMDRQFASIGVSKKFGRLDCHLTYQHGFQTSRHVSGAPTSGFPYNQSADGTYTSKSDAIDISLGYAF